VAARRWARGARGRREGEGGEGDVQPASEDGYR
jgi:hypothetical protein